MSELYPYKLITPNCPDGLLFGSLEQLVVFLSKNVLNVSITINYSI